MNAPINRVSCLWPAAPGNAATIVMVSSHPKLSSSLDGAAAGAKKHLFDLDGREMSVPANSIEFVEITWLENNQAGAANAIRVYALLKDGVTWRETDVKDDNGAATIGSGAPQTVGVLATPAERRILIDVARYKGFAIQYTAGATGPTETTGWNGTIMLHLNSEAIAR